ncbi:MAG TPA: chromosome partitioning protein ParB [Eubacteriaceae bacterium]|nr:chromosome partitioning protein ParB [Eubacteriaceae bacterium]
MKSKKGLGKGLSALIPEDSNYQESPLTALSIDDIKPNQKQPRTIFHDEKLAELADSIKEHGVIQPLIVTKADDGYVIVAWERRWRAAKKAGLKELPVVIRDITDQEIMELALIENLQREDLNDIETACAYKDLMEQYQLTQQQISEQIGKSRTAIANTLRLLNLDTTIQQYIKEGLLTSGHARAILSVAEHLREDFAQRIIKGNLSVRQAEKEAADFKGTKPKIKKKTEKDIYIQEVEDRIRESIGAKVTIHSKKNKGTIEIAYGDNDELQRLTELLTK